MKSSVKISYWSHNVSSTSIEDVNFKKYSDEKFQQIFMHIITQSAKDNTYKFAFARFLLEYVENETKKERTKQKNNNNNNRKHEQPRNRRNNRRSKQKKKQKTTHHAIQKKRITQINKNTNDQNKQMISTTPNHKNP